MVVVVQAASTSRILLGALLAMLLILGIHTHTVKCNSLDDFSAHNFNRTVGWQLKVEEASVSLGQQLVLV